MVSVASGGKAERIAARIRVRILRAGSATVAMYSWMVLGVPFPFFCELESPDCFFLMPSMLQGPAHSVHARICFELSRFLSQIYFSIKGNDGLDGGVSKCSPRRQPRA